MLFQVTPASFDVIQFGGVFRQPFAMNSFGVERFSKFFFPLKIEASFRRNAGCLGMKSTKFGGREYDGVGINLICWKNYFAGQQFINIAYLRKSCPVMELD